MFTENQKDPGAVFLQEIGFTDYGDGEIGDRLESLYGWKKADKLLAEWDNIGSGTNEFYEFKNSDPSLSRIFSETFDGDILRQACNYVSEHREYFGSTILEVGCESGYMTAFLAGMFPDSKIVSIDRCEPALKMAEKRISDMNISNVEFRNCSLRDVDGLYDTVFCMRTIQENFNKDNTPYEGEPLLYQFAVLKALTEEYTQLLIGHLKESGSLCVFERIGHDSLLCGWLLQLEKSSCGILLNTYKEIQCREAFTKNTFQAFIAKKGNKNTLKQILDLWYAPISHYDSSMNVLHGWKALDYLNRNAGRLIRGVRIYDNETGDQIGRFALFEDCDSYQTIYFLVSTGNADDVTLFSYDRSVEHDILGKIQEMIKKNEEVGYYYKELDPSDKILEGNIKIGFVKKYQIEN